MEYETVVKNLQNESNETRLVVFSTLNKIFIIENKKVNALNIIIIYFSTTYLFYIFLREKTRIINLTLNKLLPSLEASFIFSSAIFQKN